MAINYELERHLQAERAKGNDVGASFLAGIAQVYNAGIETKLFTELPKEETPGENIVTPQIIGRRRREGLVSISGTQIKGLRKRLSLSQEALAQSIERSQGLISAIERGAIKSVSTQIAASLSMVLNLDLGSFNQQPEIIPFHTAEGQLVIWDEAKDSTIIHNKRFGDYKQTIYDSLQDAGHKQLASKGKYGWNMPTDPATKEFVDFSAGKVILEIGTGLGDTITIPSLIQGATVYATDISPEHLSDDSLMRETAKLLNKNDSLHTCTLKENWWDQPLKDNPTVKSVLDTNDLADLPADGQVDAIMARHSLQFGDPNTFIRFLDLTAAVLKQGGTATSINFTPYTEYMYQYDQGKTMKRIALLNSKFAKGEIPLPGGYMHKTKGPIKLSLSQLMGKQELDRGLDNRFLYFDEETLEGLLNLWKLSRLERKLPINLEINETAYFSPPSIARVNKLTSSAQYENKENFVFTLKKK